MLLSFTVLPWYYHGSNRFFAGESTTFGKLHDDISQLEQASTDKPIDFGISKIYYGGLCWALLALTVLLGLLAAVPLGRWSRATRAAAGAVSVLGLGLTFWVVAPFQWAHSTSSYLTGLDSPSYLTWLAHGSFGFWFAVAGFVLTGAAAWLGPRGARSVR
jgi:hypothetical protein